MRLRRRAGVTAVAVAVLLALVTAGARLLTCATAVRCQVLARSVPADGRWHPVAQFWRRFGPLDGTPDLTISGVNRSQTRWQNDQAGAPVLLYRPVVTGGDTRLQVRAARAAWTLPVSSTAILTDSRGDGLPDALRLHDAEDRARFRRWFTALAEHAAALPDAQLPTEVTDCSALLRWSYRVSLLRHDDRWYRQFAPGEMPALPSVEQWNYPDTPLGAGLFRVTLPGGTPQPSDFAQFADAKTLYTLNSFRVSRDVRLAKSGDLLFFHQLEQGQQYHSMIVTGDGGAWVVYHTGPEHALAGGKAHRGEMRRARIAELLQHPDPRWHPSQSNPNFLGVYR